MYINGRWVIALDHTKIDNDLLKYVFDLCKIFPPEKIFLINVLKERKSYSHLPEEFFGFMNQVEEDPPRSCSRRRVCASTGLCPAATSDSRVT